MRLSHNIRIDFKNKTIDLYCPWSTDWIAKCKAMIRTDDFETIALEFKALGFQARVIGPELNRMGQLVLETSWDFVSVFPTLTFGFETNLNFTEYSEAMFQNQISAKKVSKLNDLTISRAVEKFLTTGIITKSKKYSQLPIDRQKIVGKLGRIVERGDFELFDKIVGQIKNVSLQGTTAGKYYFERLVTYPKVAEGQTPQANYSYLTRLVGLSLLDTTTEKLLHSEINKNLLLESIE